MPEHSRVFPTVSYRFLAVFKKHTMQCPHIFDSTINQKPPKMKNTETINVFNFNNRVVHVNMDDVTQDESLVPAGGGNSLNWVIGHMLVSRDDILEEVGLARRCDDELVNTYKRGSHNVTSENARDIKELIKMFDATQNPLVDKISELDFTDKPDKLKSLTFLAFHEAYHCGQTGILRRIAGKPGAIK